MQFWGPVAFERKRTSQSKTKSFHLETDFFNKKNKQRYSDMFGLQGNVLRWW